MTYPFRSFFLACMLLVAGIAQPAAETDLRTLVDALAVGKLKDKEDQIAALAATGDAGVVPTLEAMAAGNLYFRKSDKAVFITREAGNELTLIDPLTGETVETVPERSMSKIKVNNKLRRILANAVGGLTLLSKDRDVRLAATATIFKSGDPDTLPQLEEAIEKETDAAVKQAMLLARAAALLKSDAGEEAKIEAVGLIAREDDRDALSKLLEVELSSEGALKEAATAAIARVNRSLVAWDAAQNVWYGISLGSVLLLAAIGLAITFGVMGVINMAHGEMVMLGAYTTFVVQDLIRTASPGLFDYSLAIAVPAAFLVVGAFGFALERGVIRFLYGRPLETLLATWGISLVLQQAVRSVFGPTNKEVGNPSWMSGSFELGNLLITANRLWIVVFALIVFAALLAVLKRTRLGLQMRAVTQNRGMASSMGIRTPWVDAFTFALGSGIAGIAGVALSQIDNVSPNLGQGYIIDSFMVVVFGGVGNLWGTLIGAMTLGVANKFLEPYAGAVLAKILILVIIILFIQKRPRGLFALKGRAVEA